MLRAICLYDNAQSIETRFIAKTARRVLITLKDESSILIRMRKIRFIEVLETCRENSLV